MSAALTRWLAPFGLVLAGLLLTRRDILGADGISVATHGAALVGSGVALAHLPLRDAITTGAAAFLAWRLGFFPVLVLSGHLAAISEWVLPPIGGVAWTVYPVLLLGVAGGMALATVCVHLLLVRSHPRLALGAAAALALAAAMSFTGADDLAILADETPLDRPAALTPLQPRENVYAEALRLGDVTTVRKPLLAAAAVTYHLIPPSPWARTVKGTLEGAFRAHPSGSSRARVHEHFRAFAAAHTRLNGRR